MHAAIGRQGPEERDHSRSRFHTRTHIVLHRAARQGIRRLHPRQHHLTADLPDACGVRLPAHRRQVINNVFHSFTDFVDNLWRTVDNPQTILIFPILTGFFLFSQKRLISARRL